MKKILPRPNGISFLLLACCCWFSTAAYAQFFPGGGGGGGGGRSGASQRNYPNNTQIGDATISIDPDTRRLVIVTDEDTNLQISNVISSLDRIKPQVLIKVVFLEVTYNNSLDLGVEGGFTKQFSNSSSSFFGGQATGAVANVFGLSGLGSVATNIPLNALGQPIQSFSPIPPGAGLYQVLGQDYQATLRAIAQAGHAEVLSRPSILARNNQPATISLGQSVPLVTATRFDAVNGQINTVTYQSVGIILRVTPFITADGMVEMIVQPETSELADKSQWVPISAGALAPVINQRSADTVVVVPDGQTVIIGGLMQRSKSQADSKIPILGDIPGLGALFRHRQKADSKTELMIFLTPLIVNQPSELASLTLDEKHKMLKAKSITEKELNQFLDGLPTKDNPKNNNSYQKELEQKARDSQKNNPQ
jgi:general secretion pathway protein D